MKQSVSIVIPVYRAEKYLRQAVESAIQQPETLEVILVEDGSPDGSLAVCQDLQEEHSAKVRLLQHPGGENRGAGATRNLGLREASADFIAFLDADDFMLPGRFSRSIPMLLAKPELDGVHEAVGSHFEADDDHALRTYWLEERGMPQLFGMKRAVPPEQLFETLTGLAQGAGWFCTDGIVVRKSFLERVGYFEESLKMCQDTQLWLRMALCGRLAAGQIEAPVAMRRYHAENRILTNRDQHDLWRDKMWRSLDKWTRSAPGKSFRSRYMQARVYKWIQRAEYRHAKGLSRRIRQARSSLLMAVRNPDAIRSPMFRRHSVEPFLVSRLQRDPKP